MDGLGGGSVRRYVGGAKASGMFEIQFGFAVNAAAAPVTKRGPAQAMFAITRPGGTGLYRCTFSPPLNARGQMLFPALDLPAITLMPSVADITVTNRFEAYLINGWSNTTKSFDIQCTQSAAAFNPPANTGNWIDVIFSAVCR